MTRAEIGSKTIVLAYDPDGRLSKSIVDGTVTEFLYDGERYQWKARARDVRRNPRRDAGNVDRRYDRDRVGVLKRDDGA